jgi:ribosomal protein S18 acetylase RimI-like enzyme
MRLIPRRFQSDKDDERVREFFRDVFLRNDRRELSWPLYRWDYWRWFVNPNISHYRLEAALFIWETMQGELAALVNPDGPGEAFLQVHPHWRSPELEVEMIMHAETQFAVNRPGGGQRLTLWAPASDTLRQDILRRRGYTRQGGPEYQRRRDMARPVAPSPMPVGYACRPLGDVDEHPARSWLSWRVFHPSAPDERYGGHAWYRDVQRAPLYRRDLDLVAVAPGGELAAFCTLWYDDATRTAAFEPVGTHPDHQRRGLGRALMAEGLRRVAVLGATLTTVGSYSEAAHALYTSAGFTDYDLSEPWVKEW